MLNSAQREQAISILDAAADLTIATNRADGYPQATTVSFVHDGLTIYFGTGAQAQKAKNIARDGRVSITVDLPYANWDDIKGLSLGGRATRVTSPDEMGKIGALMFAKFPQLKDIAQNGFDMTLFRVDPEVVSILDYSRGFGHTEQASV